MKIRNKHGLWEKLQHCFLLPTVMTVMLTHCLTSRLCAFLAFSKHTGWENPQGRISLSYSLIRGKDTEREKNTLETQWKSFEGCKIAAGLPWGKLGELQTNNRRAFSCSSVSNIKELAPIIFKIQIFIYSWWRNNYTSNPELFRTQNCFHYSLQ